jgi:hypothetical protein
VLRDVLVASISEEYRSESEGNGCLDINRDTSGIRGHSRAAQVQDFFHDLYGIWCHAVTEAGIRSKSHPSTSVDSSSQLPAIVVLELTAKLSDPDEPMGIRRIIERFLREKKLSNSTVTFLQDILQQVSSSPMIICIVCIAGSQMTCTHLLLFLFFTPPHRNVYLYDRPSSLPRNFPLRDMTDDAMTSRYFASSHASLQANNILASLSTHIFRAINCRRTP